MQVEKISIETLIPYANNARTHSDAQVAQIAASIREFGFNNPVLIDEQSGIIAGHGRVLAARKLELDSVPCIRLNHLSETQRRAYIIADNKLAINAGWDDELLALEFEGLGEEGFDLELTGFTLDEIAELSPKITEGLTDEDAVPEVPETPITKLGDVWLLDKHRVMCGDSTSIDAVEKLMDGQKAEILFTSPPYSDMRDYNKGKDLSVSNLTDFIPSYFGRCNYQVVNLGIQIKDREVVSYWDDYISKARSCGYKLLAWNVWNKTQGGSIASATAMFMLVHEWIFVFGEDFKRLTRTEENQIDKYKARHGEKFLDGMKGHKVRQTDGSIAETTSKAYTHHQLESVIEQVPELGSVRKSHPALFPVALPEKYILAMTSHSDLVIDSFGGGGTTLIACEKTGRINRSMELDEKYVDVIVKRWQEFTGKKATLESTGVEFDLS